MEKEMINSTVRRRKDNARPPVEQLAWRIEDAAQSLDFRDD